MMMKAAVIEKVGDLVVRDVPKPQVGDYDVLCELLYGATCTGTDQHLIGGRFPWPVTYPTILGHESVGRAVELGSKVRHFRVGDVISRVGTPAGPDGSYAVNWGGFAEFGIARDHWAMRADGLPPSAWRSYRVNQVIPPSIDPRAATMIITWRETLSYLNRMGAQRGDSVLVVGSGGNGLAFTVHASNAGASQVVVVGSDSRRAAGQAAGAHAYVDYRAADLNEQLSALQPGGFDFIIDSVGQSDSADNVLPFLRAGGIVGIYGVDDYSACRIRPNRARGTFTIFSGGYDEAETHHQVVEMILDGRLDARLWLDMDHVYPLDQIGAAFDAVRDRLFVKALVKLSNG